MSNSTQDDKNRRDDYGDSTNRVPAEEHQTPEDAAINPGDRISEDESVEEKSEDIAVESWDPVGKVRVPEYFVAEDEETGEEKAMHHVKDAEDISDTIRKARVNEEGEREWR